MALATEFDRHPPASADARIAIAGDRSRDFRRARRHSMLVRLLRGVLPLIAIGVVVFYAYTVSRTAGWGERLPHIAIPKIDPVNLTMDNPHYEGFNSNGGKYVVSAETARQELSKLGTFKLTGIKGRLTQRDQSFTDLWARTGTYDNPNSILELFERVEVAGSSGLKAHLTQATVQVKESIVKSREPVLVEMPSGTVRARGMTLRQKSRDVTFSDDVRTHIVPPNKPGAVAPAGQATPLLGAGGGPIDIASQRLDVDDNGKVALFTGEVRAVQGDNSLRTPELTVTYEGQASPGPSAMPGDQAGGQSGAKIKRILAKGPVQLNRGVTDQATCDALEHDAGTELTILTGTVVLTSLPDRRVTGDRAELDARADTVLLTGPVVILRGLNELHGRRLFLDRKTGRTALTSPAEKSIPAGRITARFYREQPANPVQAAAKAVAAAVPAATEAASAFGVFKADPSAPIDIDAERLDVDDHAKAAVFHGDVHAVQGDLTIHTVELIARYSGSAGLVADPKVDPASPQPGTQLTKIEARKKVVITSAKSGQKAVGDWADFDMKTNTILLGGDVLLSQGQNVVRGTKLKIDMVSGESRIITDPNEGWVAHAQPKGKPAEVVKPPADAPTLKSDRPSAVFYLPQKKAAGAPSTPAPAAQPAPAVDGWAAKTAPGAGQPTKVTD